MASNYRASAEGTCWKQHTCVACGSGYRYIIKRKGEATASTAAAAQEAARKQLQKLLTEEVDIRACPLCGLVQPEMIGQTRASSHGCMTWLTVALAGVLAALRGFGWVEYRTICFVAAIVAALIALKHVRTALHNPNRDVNANKSKAADDAQKGITMLASPGTDPQLGTVPTELSSAMKAAFVMLLGSVLLPMSAEGLRRSRGWAYNERCEPPVCGPGEVFRFQLGKKINSIKGYWGGTATVVAQNEVELGLGAGGETFTATTQAIKWPGRISFKSSEKSQGSSIYADIRVPNNPAMNGKTATLDVTVHAQAPIYQSGNIVVQPFPLTQSLTLAISAPESGKQYLQSFWGGIFGGMLLQFIAGLVLWSKARRLKQGLPTQLFPIS